MTDLTPLAKDFLSRNPFKLGHYQGADIYENPTYGEYGQMIVIHEGKKKMLAVDCEMSDLRLHGLSACLA